MLTIAGMTLYLSMKITVATVMCILCFSACSEMEIAWVKKMDFAGPGSYQIADIERIDHYTFIAGTFRPEDSSSPHCFIAAFDTNDAMMWHVVYEDPDQCATGARSLCVQRGDNTLFDTKYEIYVYTWKRDTDKTRRSLLLKYAHDGTLMWLKDLTEEIGGNEKQSMFFADAQGNFYVIGRKKDARDRTTVFIIQIGKQGEIVKKDEFTNISFGTIKADVYDSDDIVFGGNARDGHEVCCVRFKGEDQGFVILNTSVFTSDSISGDMEAASDSRTFIPYEQRPYISDLKFTRNGNVILLGATWDQNQGYDYLTVCYDKNDSVIWQQRFNGPLGSDDEPVALGIDDSDCVYVTGGTADDGEGSLQYNDIMTLKYDAAGNELWSRRFANKKGENSGPVYFYPDKAIHGATTYNVYIYGAVDNDGLIVKYNSNGFLTWFTRIHYGHKHCIPTAGASHMVAMHALSGVTADDTLNDALLVKFRRSEQLGLIRWD